VTDRESGDVAVIDPGDDARIIARRLESQGNLVRHVLLTHGHYDHLGAAFEICEITGVPCSAHKDDIPLLHRAPIYALAFENKEMKIPGNICGFDNGYAFELGNHTIEILSTPGHTPGSVCFNFGAFIFSGDTLLKGSAGRTQMPGGDENQVNRSVEYLVTNLTTDPVILPGHGSPWDIASARDWWNGGHSELSDQGGDS